MTARAVRRPHDFYPTPIEVTQRFLKACPLPDGAWFDPCVGDGAIIKAVGKRWSWESMDIRRVTAHPFVLAHATMDYLTYKPHTPCDVIITNPPYSKALEFVVKARTHATYVAMLLRLGFLESERRREFHRQNPSDVYVLSKRPSFTGDGKTDASAYAWFVWGPRRGGRWEVI